MNHVLMLEHFDALASGRGGPETVRVLLDAEYSRRLLLLRRLLDLAAQRPELLGPCPSAAEAWDALEAIQDRAPDVLRTVLLSPQVGTWFTHSLRRVRIDPPPPDPHWSEVGQVHAVALAAAIRAGLPLRTRVPVRRGGVLLPTLGLARFPSAHGYAVAHADTTGRGCVLRVGDDEATVPADPATGAGRWWPVRRLTCRSGDRVLEIDLEDVDSYRDLADPVEPARLDDPTLQTWQRLLDDAWALLVRWHPATADTIAAGLHTIAPLPDDPCWLIRNASTGDGFGGALISLPPDPLTLAVAVVHELQHIKLGGLLHLVTLHEEGDYHESRYAPWRPDPRPLPGLLQGVYAFFGVTEFWRTQRRAGTVADRPLADFEFAYARGQTWAGLRTLVHAGHLTPLGERFIAQLAGRLRSWLAEPVPAEAARAAWAASADHRAGWRIRHVPADPAWVAAAARAWLGGGDPPPVPPRPTRVRRGGPTWTHDRVAQHRIRLGAGHLGDWSSRASAADLALLNGVPERARDEYLAGISADPTDYDAWTGLGLALAATGRTPAWRPLLHRPELVYALYHELSERKPAPAPPVDLALWLATRCPTTAAGPYRSRRGCPGEH